MDTLRIIHCPARSGATIMSKAIAVHEGVELYSEIHAKGPESVRRVGTDNSFLLFNIKVQAFSWFQHYDDSFQDRVWTADNINNAVEDIDDVIRLTMDRGKVPVLRDWSHLDFFGAPFCTPSHRSTLRGDFQDRYDIAAVSFTRHPLSMWLSFKMNAMLGPPFSSLEGYRQYLEGYSRYAVCFADIPQVKYEDFMTARDQTVAATAQALKLNSDPDYTGKMADYNKLTGDPTAMGRHAHKPDSRQLNKGFFEQLIAEPALTSLCQSLGYDPTQVPHGYHLV